MDNLVIHPGQMRVRLILKNMIVLADSDLFFYIGLWLEVFVENAEKTMKGQHIKMIPITLHREMT